MAALFVSALLLLFLGQSVSAQWERALEEIPRISELPTASVAEILRSLVDWLLYIVGFIAVAGFLWSGLLFLVSGGSEGRIEQAKRALLYSIVGVAVALVGVVAIRWIDSLLRAQLP